MAFERELHRATSGEEGLDIDLEREKAARLKKKRDAELAARVPGRRTLVQQLPVPPVTPPMVLEYRGRAMKDVATSMGAIARGERAGLLQTGPTVGETMLRVAERRAHTLMRRAQDHGDIDTQDPAVEESLRQMGGGKPLPAAVRKKMEAEFGVSFDRVRVHTDGVAAQAAAAVHAEAFTVGEDIFFAEGAFDPSSRAGQHLIAHELTHVVQGMEGRVAAEGGVSKPGQALETEAEHRAERAMARGSTPAARPVPGGEPARAPRTVVVKPAAAAPGVHAAPIMRKATAGIGKKKKGKVRVQATRDANDVIPKVTHDGRAKLNAGKAKLDQLTGGAKAQAKSAIDQAHKHAPKKHPDAKDDGHHKHIADAKHKAHEHATKHTKNAHHDKPHHDNKAGGDKNDGTGAIQLKKVSDWEKLLPKPLPDQDEREKNKILGLVKAKVEKDRHKSAKLLSSLRSAQLKAAAGISAMKGGLQGEIAGAQKAALGKVASAEAAQVASVQSHISGLQAQVRGAATAAIAAVNQAHQQTIQQMSQAFSQANQKLAQDHTQSLSKLQADTQAELTTVQTEFETAENDVRAYGGQKASEASAMGDMALPYSGDQLDAARKAAHEVAEKYAAAMPENANQAAEQVAGNLGDAQEAVQHTSDGFKTNIDAAFNQAKTALQQQHQQMVQAANQAHTQSVSQIRQASSAAVSALGALMSQTVASLRGQAASAKSRISSAGAAAIAGVGSACDQAASGVRGGAEGVIQAASKMETPDPEGLGREVAKARKDLTKGASAAAAGLRTQASSSAGGLTQQATAAAGALAQAAAAANASASKQAQSAEQGIHQTADAAKQTQHKIGEEFKKSATKLTTQTHTQLQQLNEHAKTAFSDQTTALQGKLQSFVQGCKGKLDEAVPGKERPDILAQAKKAADSVPKHWWQKVVSFVVKVVIAVAIGVAVGALIAATGGVGGILLAVAIGAAGGALGYTASLVAGNLIEGKSAFEGFSWKGLAIGAIAGGISGGAGAWLSSAAEGATGGFLGAFAEGASGLGNFAIKTATDFGISMVSDAAAQLIVNHSYKVTLSDILLTAATAGISNSSKLVGGGSREGGTGESEPAGGGGGEPDLGGGGSHGGGGGSNEGAHAGGSNEGAHAGGSNEGAHAGGSNEGAHAGGSNEGAHAGGSNEGAHAGGSNEGAHAGGSNEGAHAGGADEGAHAGGSNEGRAANDNARGGSDEAKSGESTTGKSGETKSGSSEKGGSDETKSGGGEKTGSNKTKGGKHEAGEHEGGEHEAGEHEGGGGKHEKTGSDETKAGKHEKAGDDEQTGGDEYKGKHRKPDDEAKNGEHEGGEHEAGEHEGGGGKHEKTGADEHKNGEHEGGEHEGGEHEGGEHGAGEHKKPFVSFDKEKLHDKIHEALHPQGKQQIAEDAARFGEKASDGVKESIHEKDEEKKKEHEEEEKSEKETEEHSHPEMPELEISEKELKEDGYAAASPSTFSRAIDAINSGQVPDAKSLRVTQANQQGRAQLQKILQDPHRSPEQRQKFQRDLAARLSGGNAPSGNLKREVDAVRQQEKREAHDKPGEDESKGSEGEDPYPGSVQRKAEGAAPGGDVHAIAAQGTQGAGSRLPHFDQIQRSFGSHDISGVQAYTGGAAAAASAQLGAKAYAHGNAVAFAGSPDLHTAAHEAAHVVQQRGGVQLKGGIDGGANDPYEHHADAVADAVVAGKSAENLLDGMAGGAMSSAPAVQRFVEREHKAIGDEGAAGRQYSFAGGLKLTHGDLVMLSGDHFSPADLQTLLGKPSPSPGTVPDTQDEILCVLHNELGSTDPRFAPGGEWAGIKFSKAVETAVEKRYYGLAQKNDMHFPNPRGPGSAGTPGSAGGAYRALHEKALAAAYDLGAQGKDISQALATEAMGQHFLTDSFASGHMSTPRTAIGDYWNTKYPNFGQQFIDKLAHDIAVQLGKDATLISDAIPVSVIEGKAKTMIKDKLGAKPLPKFGDIVSLAIHGFDNAHGLRVTNDVGWHWSAHGDHKLEAPFDPNPNAIPPELRMGPEPTSCTISNRDVAVTAVQLGIGEIYLAYAMGKAAGNNPVPPDQLLRDIKSQVASPARPGDKYGAEQLVPRVDSSQGPDQGEVNWKTSSIAALWDTRIRSTQEETFGDFLFNDMLPSGEMGGEMEAIKGKLDEKMDPVPTAVEVIVPVTMVGHGYLYPRKAFQKSVLDKLHDKKECLAFLQAVVGEK